MSNKIKAFIALFFLQFIVSMCCDCQPVKTYDVSYIGLDAIPIDTAGFDEQEVNGPVFRNNFALTLVIETDITQVSSVSQLGIGALGFSSAYATQCDCPYDEYNVVDNISNLEITLINLDTDVQTNVTEWFVVYNYSGEPQTINEFITTIDNWQTQFNLELDQFENMPANAKFLVKVTLASGFELEKETNVIEFI